MLKFASSALVIGLISIYIGNTIYSLYNLFNPELCKEQYSNDCIYPMLDKKLRKWPNGSLYIRISPNKDPFDKQSIEVYKNMNFDISKETEKNVKLKLTEKLKNNLANLQLHAIFLHDQHNENPSVVEEKIIISKKLVTYKVPEAKVFNLISEDNKKTDKKISNSKVPHLMTRIYLTIVEDALSYPLQQLPPEIISHLKLENINGYHHYYPIFNLDDMSSRMKDLLEIRKDNDTLYFTVNYRPLSIGKFRLLVNGQLSLQQFKQFGFNDKDFDEIKGIFTDTNFYFLSLTVFVSTVHLLLDILSFKNDISFWKNRDSMEGLSTKTLMWRCLSQTIIFFYLYEERTSALILIPSGFGVIVEFWKLTKALKITWEFKYGIFLPRIGTKISEAEQKTNEIDNEAMKYLSKLMIPLCTAGAVYSLLYEPHKSWYSWVINCLANGVYAFGFLFMLPQLFLNYKLKSVAHLPWRAFMYKAFNTFIDDMFAFIINMPTSHRVACFRDDVVFLIYLYQRYLYPVDKKRVNEFGQAFFEENENSEKKDN